MSKSKFPQFLHVKIENAGTDEAYFDATDDPEAHAQIGKDVQVAVYKLVEVDVLRSKVERFVRRSA